MRIPYQVVIIMTVNMSVINAFLEAYHPTYRAEGDPDQPLAAIVPLGSGTEYDESALYVGRIQALPNPLPRNFLGIGDVVPPCDWAPLPHINLTLLPEDTRLDEILMSLCSLFLTEENTMMASFASEVLDRLSVSNDLRSITELAYQYFGNPILVSDNNWRAMVLWPMIDLPEDPDWTKFKDNGMLTIEVVTENMRANLAQTLSESTEPFYWKDDRMAYGRLFCNVHVGKHSAATISVLEVNRSFTAADYALLPIYANAVSAEMQKRESLGFSRGLNYEKFLADMLEGSVTSLAIANDRLKSLNIHLKKYLYLFAVDIRDFDSGNFSVNFFRDYLERVVPESKALVFDSYIVLFKSYSRPNRMDEIYQLSELRNFLIEHRANCGISRCFEQITDMSAALHQAVEAISVGVYMEMEKPFFQYDDLVLYHIAKICSEHNDLERLCSPKVLELLRYDKKNNTAFSRSLYTYFKNSRNITQTAAELNLHRNSMIYHLKKIEEILDIKLSGADNLLYMELSYRFLEYGKTPID